MAAYHELAAAAHRQHSQVEASLPTLSLPVPAAEEVIEVEVNGAAEEQPGT